VIARHVTITPTRFGTLPAGTIMEFSPMTTTLFPPPDEKIRMPGPANYL
jgi:hypothetical protein